MKSILPPGLLTPFYVFKRPEPNFSYLAGPASPAFDSSSSVSLLFSISVDLILQ